MTGSNRTEHIRLTSHPDPGAKARFPIVWGAATARERGPVIATVSRPGDRNVIGSHGGSYALYRALAVSSGALDPIRRPDLTNTHPAHAIGPFAQWADPNAIVSLDPWGHLVADEFGAEIAERYRHPPDDCGDQSAPRACRDAGCHRCRPAQDRRSGRAGSWRHLGCKDRDRSGLVSSRYRQALRKHRNGAAPRACSSRPPACFRNW